MTQSADGSTISAEVETKTAIVTVSADVSPQSLSTRSAKVDTLTAGVCHKVKCDSGALLLKPSQCVVNTARRERRKGNIRNTGFRVSSDVHG